MIAEKLDQEMLAALTRLGFDIEDGERSAFAEFGVLIGDNMDFCIQIYAPETGQLTYHRVTREQILSAARAINPEDVS
jgi:hypothetical protein